MYTSTIGRIFLDAYNEKYNTKLTPKEFFLEIYIPLFFGHNKYMMTGGNSPLENPKISWDKIMNGEEPYEDESKRKERIESLIDKIDNSVPNMGIAIGYGVADPTTPSACQITGMENIAGADDTYLSWIGAGLGVTLSGGYTLLFDHKQILLDIFDGWKEYRKILNNNDMLKGNQVNSWSGRWLIYLYSDDFEEGYGIPQDYCPLETEKDGIIKMSAANWLEFISIISVEAKSTSLMSYIYKIGQTNSTYGFIPINTEEILRPEMFYRRIFGENISQAYKNAMRKIYGDKGGFPIAFNIGSIGIRSLEPKDLVKYMPQSNGKKPKPVKYKTEEDKININLYIIWILAMLNKEDFWETTEKFAKSLYDYSESDKKLSTKRKNQVEKLLSSTNAKNFLDNAIEIINESDTSILNAIKEMGKAANDMPWENFPYFCTLIKLHYAIISKNS